MNKPIDNMEALLERDRLDDKRREDLEAANDRIDEDEADGWQQKEADFL